MTDDFRDVKQQDVQDRLERALLNCERPPSHVRAANQLRDAKIRYTRIVSAEPEAILFTIGKVGSEQAWTAWTEVQKTGTVVVYRQEGFPAFPSPYLKDQK